MKNKVIHSKNNAHFKYLKSLSRKKERWQTKTFLLEGERYIRSAIARAVEPKQVIVCEGEKESDWPNALVLTATLFREISDTEHSQGVLGVYDMPTPAQWTTDTLLILDQIQDPGNMGAIIRTAVAAGMIDIGLISGCVDPYNSKSVRSSAGAILFANLVPHSYQDLADLKSKGYKVMVTDLEGMEDYETLLTRYEKKAIIIGNEAHGVSIEAKEQADHILRIPLSDQVESLNAAVAAGIIIYAARRNHGATI